MTKFYYLSSLFLGSCSVLASPISSTIKIAGLKDIHWPAGRPLPVKVTKGRHGNPIGWVKRDAQVVDHIAKEPPPTHHKVIGGREHPEPEFSDPTVEKGPEGTVPYQLLTVEQVQYLQKHPKRAVPKLGARNEESRIEKRACNGHFYANSGQGATNWGSSAYYSLYTPKIDETFALIQVAMTRANQTAELGWQAYPFIHNNSQASYVFTYYTVNGYSAGGDNLGCYNTACKGWVQVSSTYYPGMTFSTVSTVNGKQYETPMSYYLYQGNWWVSINNNWAGYYPGSLYARSGTTSGTLGENSDYFAWYGEIVGTCASPGPKQDMGSGLLANQGFGRAAYFHNIVYYTDSSATQANYNGGFSVSNNSWYTNDPHMNSGTNWASYFYLGGPGSS